MGECETKFFLNEVEEIPSTCNSYLGYTMSENQSCHLTLPQARWGSLNFCFFLHFGEFVLPFFLSSFYWDCGHCGA